MADASRDARAAAHYFREALREDPRNAELLERAFVASVQDGSFNEAFRLAERVLQRDPNNALALLTLGVRALKNRQFITARSHFQKAGGRGRNADLSAALLTAWTYVGNGNLKQALETVDRFSEPQLAVYRLFYGGLMADVGNDRREAAKRLKAAYELDVNTVRLADTYARFEARHGKREHAKEIYARLAEKPGNLPFIANVKKIVDEGGTPDPLVQNVAQGAAEVLYTSSDTGGRGRGAELIALIYLQLAHFLHGENDMVLVSLAENFEQLKQYDRAIELYNRVPEDSGIKIRTVIRSALALARRSAPTRRCGCSPTASPRRRTRCRCTTPSPRSIAQPRTGRPRPRRRARRSRSSTATTAITGACSTPGASPTSATSNGRRPKPTSSMR